VALRKTNTTDEGNSETAVQGFGQRLERARLHRAMTQADLAVKSGVGKSVLSRLEREVRRSTEAETLLRLSAALDVRPQWLWHGEEPMELRDAKRASWKKHSAPIEDIDDANLKIAIAKSRKSFHRSILAVAVSLSRDGERHTVSGWRARLEEIRESLAAILPTREK
jgi:transcriptional regulator with XRE-family HTH domain